MRLSPQKIEHLTNEIFEALAGNQEVTLEQGRDAVVTLMRKVIMEDLAAEDEIETEARRLLEEHMDEIQRKGASYEKLLRKAKQKLAQERKMVL